MDGLPRAAPPVPCTATRRLRMDAERNRAALVTAAQAVFAEQGLNAPLDEIASRAGVGIATLYRRFPTRDRLVAAALLAKVGEYAKTAEQALSDPDPWRGFAGFVERICALQAGDRGLGDLLSMALPADPELTELHRRANEKVVELVERAKAQGSLREGFVGEDLLILIIATTGVVHVTAQDAPQAWHRFVALMLDAFHAPERGPLPDPPSTLHMTRAMRRLAQERGCGGSN